MSAFWAVLWKDLLTEWRSRDRVASMGVFAALVVVILYFAAPPGLEEETRAHVPGLLWVAVLFASVLGLNRSFALELENEAISTLALAPVDRAWIFLGKAAASLVVLLAVTAVTTTVFALFFALDFRPVALPFAAVAVLGCAGLSSLGTLFAAIAVRTTYREVMLPLLLLPLMVPVLMGSVRATQGLLLEGALPAEPLRLLLVTDGVFLIVSLLGFEYVLDE